MLIWQSRSAPVPSLRFSVLLVLLFFNGPLTLFAASPTCSSLDGPFCALMTGRRLPDYALALIAAEPERQARNNIAEANAKGAIEQITQALLAAASEVAKQIREGKAKADKADSAAKGGKRKSESSFPVPPAVREKLSAASGGQPLRVDEQGELARAESLADEDSDDAPVVVVRASLPSEDGGQQTIELRVVAASSDAEDSADVDAPDSTAGKSGKDAASASTAATGRVAPADPDAKSARVTRRGPGSSGTGGGDDDGNDGGDHDDDEFIHLLSDGDVSELLRAARQLIGEDEDDGDDGRVGSNGARAARDSRQRLGLGGSSRSSSGGSSSKQTDDAASENHDDDDDDESEGKLILSAARLAARQVGRSLSRIRRAESRHQTTLASRVDGDDTADADADDSDE